jgi:hypothetical protein
MLEEVAAGWFGARGGPSVVRCLAVEDVEGGWRPQAVFSPCYEQSTRTTQLEMLQGA